MKFAGVILLIAFVCAESSSKHEDAPRLKAIHDFGQLKPSDDKPRPKNTHPAKDHVTKDASRTDSREPVKKHEASKPSAKHQKTHEATRRTSLDDFESAFKRAFEDLRAKHGGSADGKQYYAHLERAAATIASRGVEPSSDAARERALLNSIAAAANKRLGSLKDNSASRSKASHLQK